MRRILVSDLLALLGGWMAFWTTFVVLTAGQAAIEWAVENCR